MEAALKPFLKIREAAALIGVAYGTLREWIAEGRVKAEVREMPKKNQYRVPLEEAKRAKERVELGLWV